MPGSLPYHFAFSLRTSTLHTCSTNETFACKGLLTRLRGRHSDFGLLYLPAGKVPIEAPGSVVFKDFAQLGISKHGIYNAFEPPIGRVVRAVF